MNPLAEGETNRQPRVRRALDKKVVLPCAVTTQEVKGDLMHQGSTGKQRNSLSLGAKKFKRRVHEIYAPIFKAMKWKAISQQCEIRLVVQPPRKDRSYSAST